MNNKLIKNIIMIILISMVILVSISNSVLAVTKKVIDNTLEGSISLTVYEFVNGDENNKKELAGAEFTIYSVTSSETTIDLAEKYVENNKSTITSRTAKTDENGNITFSNLELGRYFVVETNAPKNVYTKVESFLVDVPSTNSDGTEWNYDIVVNPKNVTIYADVELSKTDNDGQKMDGVEFKLQKFIENQWIDYDLENRLVTGTDGKIQIHNLEAGHYRLIEISSWDGYIVDSSNTKEFDVTLKNTDIVLDMKNETVNLNKYVLLSDGKTYGKHIGADLKDTISWKITSTIPSIISKMKTYKITDTLSTGLDIVQSSIEVYGIKDSSKTKFNGHFTPVVNGQTMTITFDNNYLANFDSLEILYNTTLNSNIDYGTANDNKVSITYTDNIDVDGTEKDTYTTTPDTNSIAEVHTGELLIYKTDGEKALTGAVFKIATSEYNAKNGIYVIDANGNDITATSDENGYVIFQGLKYGDDEIDASNGTSYYWIVEVQAPSYEEEGETKYYNLLSSPVKVQINANSGEYSSSTTKIINKKGFLLPRTGAIGTITLIITGLSIIIISMCIRKKKTKDEK